MIICSHSNIDIIQGVIGYGDAEGITDWRISNTNTGILNILNSTSANVRVSILENGNVGIGTTNPGSTLDIIGDTNITGVYKKNNRDVINDTSNYVLSASNILVPRILTEVGNGSNYVSRLNTALNTRIDNTSNYVLSASNSLANGISSQWTNVSSGIHYNTGNIGIGTTNPVSKLHIYNDTINNTKLTIQNNNTNTFITSSPAARTGETGIYTYQVFTYTTETAGSGTGQTQYTLDVRTGSILAGSITCDILIVGGGGSGSETHGGGGGAGAVIFMTNVSMSGTYTIKVGNGGVCQVTGGFNGLGRKGKDSEIFKTTNNKIVAEGGGGGGQFANANGGSGGSGGGGDAYDVAAGVGGAATAYTPVLDGVTGIKYGNNGGNAFGCPGHGGGGGGAGGAGENALAANSVNAELERAHGGVGIKSATINSVNYDFKTLFGTNTGAGVLESDGFLYFGGGGGNGRWESVATGNEGGNGGLGGGGKGGWGGSGIKNVPNNGWGYPGINGAGGGGGGGGDYTPAGGNGGSGIVIIRYLTPPSSSIELIRGTSGDANIDYKIGNYSGDFKIISSTSSVDTDYIRITSSGASIYNPTGSPQWSTVSDRRIKENIEKASYDKCYNNINKLELYRFNYIKELNNINKDLKQLGYIAQEVQDIFPKAVSTQEFHNDNLCIPDMLSIDIAQINYSLYGAVKKLMEMYNDIENNINILENILNINITSNVMIDTSTSNVMIDTSTSNVMIDTSTSNVIMDTSTSNVIMDTSTSNVIMDTSTSNVIMDTSTSNVIMDTSTSNVIDDTSMQI